MTPHPIKKASVPVVLFDTNGDPITSLGGTEYTEGDTDASITGPAILWEDAGNALVPVSAAKPLPVNLTDDFVLTAPSAWESIGTITADEGVVQVVHDTRATVGLLITGSFVSTFVFEGSIDGGTTWHALLAVNLATGAVVSGGSGPGSFLLVGAGQARLRVRADGYTSGTITVRLYAGGESGATHVLSLPEPISIDDNNATISIDDGGSSISIDDGGASLTVAVTPGSWLLSARDIDLDETELEVKAGPGALHGWYIYNDGAAEVYVKLYDLLAADCDVGTDTPKLTLPIPAGSAANLLIPDGGIVFNNGICAAATTGVADSDTAAPAANQVVANFFYI